MTNVDEYLNNLVNKDFVPTDKASACWEFCRDTSLKFNMKMPSHPCEGMYKLREPFVGCVVLFKIGNQWHSGIVWPDCLHFIHAKPEDKEGTTFKIRKERLTAWPWKRLWEGFYVNAM